MSLHYISTLEVIRVRVLTTGLYVGRALSALELRIEQLRASCVPHGWINGSLAQELCCVRTAFANTLVCVVTLYLASDVCYIIFGAGGMMTSVGHHAILQRMVSERPGVGNVVRNLSGAG